ncbi:MAG: hypothetical protein HZA52_04320 [Planctomycetes bacterium]|nr:hypothetical protein [Planctomycetota bacterium]
MSTSTPLDDTRSPREGAKLELLLGVALLGFVVWYLACALSLWREAAMDDAYITYVYGRNLAEGHGLRFNAADAEPTPGASSLLHALFAAFAHARGLDPLVATRWLGLGCVAVLGAFGGWAAARATRAPLGAGVLVGGWLALGLALLPETVQHVAGGMETLLFVTVHAAYLAWVVVAADPRRAPGVAVQLLGAVLALVLTATRPEGAPLALAALACLSLSRSRTSDSPGLARVTLSSAETRGELAGARGGLAWAWGGTLLVLAGFFAWHLAYFGALVPNAYYVKTASKIFGGGGLPGLAGTFAFTWQRLLPLALIVVVLAKFAGTREEWRARAWLAVPALLVLASLTRVIREMAGGFRYEFGMLVPFVLLVGIGVLELRRRSRAAYAAVLLVTGAGLPLLFTDANSGFASWLAHPRSPTERWRQGGPQDNALAWVGLDLAKSGLEANASVLLSGAGQIPYWSKFRALDWIGLNDSYLSGRDARTLDEVWSYIDARHPDVLVSVLPPAASDGPVLDTDANFRAPAVQRFLTGFASELFERWDHDRVAEMLRREMGYIRAHYDFGVCYQLGRRWRTDWWLFVYVRRDSPHRKALLDALLRSKHVDASSVLGEHYPFDPRELRSER